MIFFTSVILLYAHALPEDLRQSIIKQRYLLQLILTISANISVTLYIVVFRV